MKRMLFIPFYSKFVQQENADQKNMLFTSFWTMSKDGLSLLLLVKKELKELLIRLPVLTLQTEEKRLPSSKAVANRKAECKSWFVQIAKIRTQSEGQSIVFCHVERAGTNVFSRLVPHHS